MQRKTEAIRPVYFLGCDMGGWHTKVKDAFAVSKWVDGRCVEKSVIHKRLFCPVQPDGVVAKAVKKAEEEAATIVIAIDAALAWPVDFLRLAVSAHRATHVASCDPEKPQIENRYLFRETERFVKKFVRKRKDPFSAPGDSFGNPTSKAQSLVAWFKGRLPSIYRPPFDKWDKAVARKSRMTLIEVYPAASMASDKFAALRWSDDEDSYKDIDASDENDAKRCVTSAECYAMTVGILPVMKTYPLVWLPDEPDPGEFNPKRIRREGWIFAPKRE